MRSQSAMIEVKTRVVMCLRIAPSLSHLRSRFGAFEVELAQVNCVSSGFIVLLPALRPIVSNRHRRQTRSTPVIFVLNIAPIEIAFPVRVQSAAVAHQAECWPCLLRGTAIAATCRTAFSLCKCVEHFARFSIQIFVQMTRINYAACEKLKRISIFLSSCALKSFSSCSSRFLAGVFLRKGAQRRGVVFARFRGSCSATACLPVCSRSRLCCAKT